MQQKDFVVIQKVCSFKTSNFRPAPPCSSMFILHAGCLWIFLNKTLRSEKRENNDFFCKLNIKDGNVFNTDIYTITAIKIFTCSYIKKGFKKCLRRFNKFFNNYHCLKNQAIFSRSEHRDRVNSSPPLPLFVFIQRVHWKKWKELMIMLVHSCI